MVREVSGATPVEIPKTAWSSVTGAGGGTTITNIGNHPAVLIDAAGEYALAEIKVPAQVKTITAVEVILVSVETSIQRFTISADWGKSTEHYNNHTYTVNTSNSLTADHIKIYDITTGMAAVAAPTAGDQIGITVTYRAAGNGDVDTNFYVLGIVLDWV